MPPISNQLVRVVDDDPMVRRAIARLLTTSGFQTEESDSAKEFLDRLDPSIPGCLIFDLGLPQSTGLQLQEELIARQFDLPVIFVSGVASIRQSVQAMKNGAVDFLVKPVDADQLIASVRAAIELDARRRTKRELAENRHARLRVLTPREFELVPYFVSGRLNKQIAWDLGVVEKTVKVHRSRVMHKLGLRSVAELVRFANEMADPLRAANPTQFERTYPAATGD